MNNIKIFIASNGHGEDAIAVKLVEELNKIGDFSFEALPLTGIGSAYTKQNIKVLGSPRIMPSGGFVRLGIKYLLKDIKAGLLGLFMEQIKILRRNGRQADIVIAVGDTFLCSLCGLFTRKKVFFISTAQSVYIGKFIWIDKWFTKHYAKIVFPRDEKTAEHLRQFGINAICMGNVMMDMLQFTGEDFSISKDKKIIGLLPGSREEAYDNFRNILKVVEEISLVCKKNQKDIPVFIAAIAPSIKKEKIMELLSKSEVKIILTDKFADCLNRSDAIIGLTGTGNEQAIGLGKPVITFPGKGPQMTLPFLIDQSKLLGGMVFIVENNPKIIAQKVLDILYDNDIPVFCKKIGVERMGESGAAARISEHIVKI